MSHGHESVRRMREGEPLSVDEADDFSMPTYFGRQGHALLFSVPENPSLPGDPARYFQFDSPKEVRSTSAFNEPIDSAGFEDTRSPLAQGRKEGPQKPSSFVGASPDRTAISARFIPGETGADEFSGRYSEVRKAYVDFTGDIHSLDACEGAGDDKQSVSSSHTEPKRAVQNVFDRLYSKRKTSLTDSRSLRAAPSKEASYRPAVLPVLRAVASSRHSSQSKLPRKQSSPGFSVSENPVHPATRRSENSGANDEMDCAQSPLEIDQESRSTVSSSYGSSSSRDRHVRPMTLAIASLHGVEEVADVAPVYSSGAAPSEIPPFPGGTTPLNRLSTTAFQSQSPPSLPQNEANAEDWSPNTSLEGGSMENSEKVEAHSGSEIEMDEPFVSGEERSAARLRQPITQADAHSSCTSVAQNPLPNDVEEIDNALLAEENTAVNSSYAQWSSRSSREYAAKLLVAYRKLCQAVRQRTLRRYYDKWIDFQLLMQTRYQVTNRSGSGKRQLVEAEDDDINADVASYYSHMDYFDDDDDVDEPSRFIVIASRGNSPSLPIADSDENSGTRVQISRRTLLDKPPGMGSSIGGSRSDSMSRQEGSMDRSLGGGKGVTAYLDSSSACLQLPAWGIPSDRRSDSPVATKTLHHTSPRDDNLTPQRSTSCSSASRRNGRVTPAKLADYGHRSTPPRRPRSSVQVKALPLPTEGLEPAAEIVPNVPSPIQAPRVVAWF